MKKKNKAHERPLNTQNALLAYCLHLAGIPWEDERHPCRVLYTPEMIRNFKDASGESIYKGKDFTRETVALVHKEGWRGHVEFMFAYTPRLGLLTKEFKKQSEYLDSATGYLHELVSGLAVQFKELEPDIAIMRMSCTILKSRPDFVELWQHQVPCLMIPNEGKVKESEGVAMIKGEMRQYTQKEHPGWKIVSVNASDETLKDMGLLGVV